MIGVSPLTGRIYSGRANREKGCFIGQKKDVTSEVLGAVIAKAEFHGGTFEIEGGGEKWTVVVTKQAGGGNHA